jgi:hypothetical protein
VAEFPPDTITIARQPAASIQYVELGIITIGIRLIEMPSKGTQEGGKSMNCNTTLKGA